MIVGIDTSILVPLAVRGLAAHEATRSLLARELARPDASVGLVPLVPSEFVHAVTDARRFSHPLPMLRALEEAQKWWGASDTIRLHVSDEAVAIFFDWMREFRLGRKRVLDTLLAATLHTSGVRRLMTANPDDFRVFGVFELLVP
jgi:predicted nucleic acid-binding protein